MQKLPSVLLIDDDPINNFVSEAVLTRLRISEKIYIEKDGKSALNFLHQYYSLHQSVPPLIFLDLLMPIMTGLEFLLHFNREFHSLKDRVRIVILSALCDDSVRSRAFQLGVVHFMEKPMTPEGLMEFLQKADPETVDFRMNPDYRETILQNHDRSRE